MTVLVLRQGDAYSGVRRLVVTAVDSAGAALDLTGLTLDFAVFQSRRDSDAILEKSTAAPGGITLATPQSGATKGVAYIAIDEADTEDLDTGDFMVYELQSTDSEGPVTLDAGRFVLLPQLIGVPA